MENILIITGGSKGLGLGLAKEYHKNGYRIISISRSKIKKFYAFEQYQCDVSDVKKIKETMIKVFSHLDKSQTKNITLINNAGTLGTVNTLEHIEPTEINYTINVNLVAPLVICSQFIKLTKNWNCKKQLFNISSGAAINPYESWAMYCSSKAGLDMMTKVIAKEQKELKNGVSIVSIYPGVVETAMQVQLRKTPKEKFKSVQRFIDLYEHGDLFTPEQVSEKIYRLDKSGELKNGRILDIRTI
jgi:benzil reductase ((S)-benzoin forming)